MSAGERLPQQRQHQRDQREPRRLGGAGRAPGRLGRGQAGLHLRHQGQRHQVLLSGVVLSVLTRAVQDWGRDGGARHQVSQLLHALRQRQGQRRLREEEDQDGDELAAVCPGHHRDQAAGQAGAEQDHERGDLLHR